MISDDDGIAISLPCDGRLEISGTEGESEAKSRNGKSLTTRVTKVLIRCAFLEVHVEEEMFAEFGDEDGIEDVEDESFEQVSHRQVVAQPSSLNRSVSQLASTSAVFFNSTKTTEQEHTERHAMRPKRSSRAGLASNPDTRRH